MKYFLILLFLTGSFTTFVQTKIDGDWKGIRETPNGKIELTYTFKVEETTLTGSLKSTSGTEVKIENGKFEDNKFSYSITINGNTRNSTGEVINENEILIKNERGEMKLTRVKS
jgi:formylmethanofuran dehydrogenase subunit C